MKKITVPSTNRACTTSTDFPKKGGTKKTELPNQRGRYCRRQMIRLQGGRDEGLQVRDPGWLWLHLQATSGVEGGGIKNTQRLKQSNSWLGVESCLDQERIPEV